MGDDVIPNIRSVKEIYGAGQVIRYHASPQMSRRFQTDADHQWGVCAIMLAIAPGEVSRDLLIHGLLHDVGERYAGDPPAQFKRDWPMVAVGQKKAETAIREMMIGPLPDLSEEHQCLLKMADIVEALLCIMTCATEPDEVEGWPDAVRKLCDMSYRFSKLTGIDSFKWLDKHINPMIRKASLNLPTVTPF